jgi:hypothetical protein
MTSQRPHINFGVRIFNISHLVAGPSGTHLSSPATQESTNRSIIVQAGLDIKRNPVLKMTNAKRLME